MMPIPQRFELASEKRYSLFIYRDDAGVHGLNFVGVTFAPVRLEAVRAFVG
jgi:hypothetical protein